ncbi:MAG: hypothetical protein NC293_07000, partial [Roseburia sp.]|nr:hypothetical protein [Roseburia sp.]
FCLSIRTTVSRSLTPDKPKKVQMSRMSWYSCCVCSIVPFCTSGGSGIFGSIKGVKAAAKGAKVEAGKDLTDASDKSVAKWVKK